MAKTKASKRPARRRSNDFDGLFLLKMVLYLLAGLLWVKVINQDQVMMFPLPVGLLIGLIFTTHEHFRIDRKIEYALLLVAMLIGYFAPFGIYVNIN